MTYHSVLKTSEDYYTALKEARFLADNMTKTIRSKTDTNIEVFPYRYLSRIKLISIILIIFKIIFTLFKYTCFQRILYIL